MERGKIFQKLTEGLRTIGEGMAMNNPYGVGGVTRPNSDIEVRAKNAEALHRDRLAVEADLGTVALDYESHPKTAD